MTAARPRSQCAVALLADIPGTGHLGDAQAHRFTLAGSDLAMRCAEFIDFARSSVEAGHKVLALYPEWRATTALRAVRFARGALGSDHIAAIGLNASPLTLSLLADQLAYLAPYLPAGMIASVTRELPRHLVSGGWLRSVTKLATLPTSFGQHLGSYSPGAAFLAVCAPEPRVVRVRNEDATAGIPFRPVEPVQVLLSSPSNVDTTAFDDRIRPALRPISVRTLPEQPLGADFFGTAKYLEFVALSAHPSALTQAVHNVRATLCRWCREPTSAQSCPFCGSATPQPAPRPATSGPRRTAVPAESGVLPPAPAPTTAGVAAHPARRPERSDRVERSTDPGGLPLMAPSGQFRSEPMRPAEIAVRGAPPPTEPTDDPLPDPTPLPPETGSR
ncbi:hypothetical protein J4H86_08620 [Spiractinospora alimapuensis]|uniref:hypothetical protein n=1 Tax=Spiractinospora alimapuensis TaxID=2820884 RepID=UPI001F2FACEC|nr:hypothetical protein [Spiractinospora alimapuensis]QVQ53764.1 hypothetical protein J4H86_08620 [Spiractinospora alimapuensis]